MSDTIPKTQAARSPKRRMTFWRRVITILVSILILVFYFWRVDWHKLGDAIMNANLWMFLAARLFPILLYLFVDVYLLQRLIVWFHRPFGYSQVLYGRASLYILSLINPQVSNGGMFLYLMRRTGIGAEKLLGLIIFRFAWSVWSINFGVTLAIAATFYSKLGFHSPIGMKYIIPGVAFIWLCLFFYLGLVSYFKRFKPGLKHRPVWTAFYQATSEQCLAVSGLTLLLAVNGVVSNYFCAISFGINIPLNELMILLPIADIISTLPVAFLGLGVTTFAWQSLWASFATPEAFLSFTIALPVVTYLIRALIAVVAMPWASKEIELALDEPDQGQGKEGPV